jgi:peptidyl-prolyl cis-trans isomerase B (cyclophilin B)
MTRRTFLPFLTLLTLPEMVSAQDQKPSPATHPVVTIVTTKGVIKLKLYPEEAPKTVANFIKLINQGFYNGLTFHRVVSGFVIQGGDPEGNGTGGPGWKIPNEDNKTLKHNRGALAMANAGPDTAGSQFYIVIDKPAPFLDAKDERGISKYTIFGEVISGQDIAEQIAVGDKMTEVTVETPPPSVPSANTNIAISVEDFAKEFAVNPVDAEEKYRKDGLYNAGAYVAGKMVTLTGTLDSFSKSSIEGTQFRVKTNISINSNTPKKKIEILVVDSLESDKKQFIKAKKGQKIVFTGRYFENIQGKILVITKAHVISIK